jgi:hypothetical protein
VRPSSGAAMLGGGSASETQFDFPLLGACCARGRAHSAIVNCHWECFDLSK